MAWSISMPIEVFLACLPSGMAMATQAVARATADPELRRALEHAARGERVDASMLELLAARDA